MVTVPENLFKTDGMGIYSRSRPTCIPVQCKATTVSILVPMSSSNGVRCSHHSLDIQEGLCIPANSSDFQFSAEDSTRNSGSSCEHSGLAQEALVSVTLVMSQRPAQALL